MRCAEDVFHRLKYWVCAKLLVAREEGGRRVVLLRFDSTPLKRFSMERPIKYWEDSGQTEVVPKRRCH